MLRKEIGLPDNIEWLGVSCQVEAQLLVSLKYIYLKNSSFSISGGASE